MHSNNTGKKLALWGVKSFSTANINEITASNNWVWHLHWWEEVDYIDSRILVEIKEVLDWMAITGAF